MSAAKKSKGRRGREPDEARQAKIQTGKRRLIQPDEPAQRASYVRQSRTVLLVDDDLAVAMAMARLLSLEGMQISTATRADEVLAMLASGVRFDVVVTDLDMPGATGAELAREIKHFGAHAPPVILLTANHQYRDDPNVAAILHKPIDGSALCAAINAVFRDPDPSER